MAPVDYDRDHRARPLRQEAEDPEMRQIGARASGTRQLLSLVLAAGVGLAGCATTSPPVGTYGAADPAVAAEGPLPRSPAAVVLNVIATPFYLAFKAAACVGSVALATPAVAITGVTDPGSQTWERQRLHEGVTTNCGPPYLLY
jgi:hypothetical protein